MAEGRHRTSPRPTAEDKEIFFSLLAYHYGKGTLDEEEFSERWTQVESATSIAELYTKTADLSFPPPLEDLGQRAERRRRRWLWFR
ncbi:MAG TPA: DUF1707 domain-containing protein [Acidimicrobiales bacterium]|nr:DUF1707 domain-containing protein [Acidimicrobiales bacterium]